MNTAFLEGFVSSILEIELLLTDFLYCLSFYPLCCLKIFAAAAEYDFSTHKEDADQEHGNKYSLRLDVVRGSFQQTHLESTNINFSVLYFTIRTIHLVFNCVHYISDVPGINGT